MINKIKSIPLETKEFTKLLSPFPTDVADWLRLIEIAIWGQLKHKRKPSMLESEEHGELKKFPKQKS